MSVQKTVKRLDIHDITAHKSKNAEPLVVLTAYTTPMAQMLDEWVDILLVGDSLGMVLYGMENTLSVTMDMMINHACAVVRGSNRALVVVDMPFASYQISPQQAFENAARLLAESGAQAVKLEGGRPMIETIEFLVNRGIPVMGHIGLTPQYALQLGGFKVQGRDSQQAQNIVADAKAVANAGVFGLVIEGVVEQLAADITNIVSVPTIGIGASASCDGQVLVSEDMLGITERVPKFVKQYANLGQLTQEAVKRYSEDVRQRKFPTTQYCYQHS